jgi:hypothetical protein
VVPHVSKEHVAFISKGSAGMKNLKKLGSLSRGMYGQSLSNIGWVENLIVLFRNQMASTFVTEKLRKSK